MNVIEIFDSIDGEGIFTGCLATFIRLAGCNMRCTYCDTPYSFTCKEAKAVGVDKIVRICKEHGNKHVTLTGGEPLISYGADYLIRTLADNGFIVNVETNGSVDVEHLQEKNVIITMDYKTLSSGENHKMCKRRVKSLRSCDVLKIVCEESDFSDIENMLRNCDVKAHVFLSPVFGKIEPKKLVEFSKHLRDIGASYGDLRVQVQLHKIIWNPDERGV